MGYLGFLFNIDLDEENENNIKYIKILGKNLVKKNIVIFVNIEKIEGNFITGISNFKEKDCDFFYLDKKFKLKPFLVFEKSKFKIGKVLANDQNVVDFEFLTFWFKGDSYRLIREALLINEDVNDLEKEICERIKFLMNYFV